MKNVAVLMEDGAFDFFLRPHPAGDLRAQESPPPGNCHPRQKKNGYAPGSARRGTGSVLGEAADA